VYKVLTKCPVCRGRLKIKRLQCENCNTVIENDFEFSRFDKLKEEQVKFVETFLQCRGSIKDVEKVLGISYPTVRAKLDEVNETLGLVSKKDTDKEKANILEKLESGEITSEEAIELLKKCK